MNLALVLTLAIAAPQAVQPVKVPDVLVVRTEDLEAAERVLETNELPKGSTFVLSHPKFWFAAYGELATTLRMRGDVARAVAALSRPGAGTVLDGETARVLKDALVKGNVRGLGQSPGQMSVRVVRNTMLFYRRANGKGGSVNVANTGLTESLRFGPNVRLDDLPRADGEFPFPPRRKITGIVCLVRPGVPRSEKVPRIAEAMKAYATLARQQESALGFQKAGEDGPLTREEVEVAIRDLTESYKEYGFGSPQEIRDALAGDVRRWSYVAVEVTFLRPDGRSTHSWPLTRE